MGAYQDYAWYTRCQRMSEKLVLLYCARTADMIGSRQVRIDPAKAVSELGIGVSQIDAALAGLGREETSRPAAGTRYLRPPNRQCYSSQVQGFCAIEALLPLAPHWSQGSDMSLTIAFR